MATYGYAPGDVLPSNVGPLGTFKAQKAPTTNSTVYTANIASGAYKGQTVYVGPDNQPWVGGSSAFYSANPGYISPITSIAKKVTWASLLGIANAPTVVAASTYVGPGANTTAQDVAAYSPGALLPGESLVVGANAAVAIAGAEAPGTYTAGSLNLSPPVAQAPAVAASGGAATNPAQAFIAAVQAAAASARAPTSALPAIPTTLTSTGTGQSVNVSATDPAIASGINAATTSTDGGTSATTNAGTGDAITSALANDINGGYSTSPLDAVNGSPSEAAGLQALQPTAVQTGGTSASNPILLFVIVGIIAVVAIVVYLKLRHKGPPPPGTSTAHSIATGDKIEPVTA